MLNIPNNLDLSTRVYKLWIRWKYEIKMLETEYGKLCPLLVFGRKLLKYIFIIRYTRVLKNVRSTHDTRFIRLTIPWNP